MSISKLLYRQMLIARKNDLQLANIYANQANINALRSINFTSLNNISNWENKAALEQTSNSAELMVINSELNVLNNASINYFA